MPTDNRVWIPLDICSLVDPHPDEFSEANDAHMYDPRRPDHQEYVTNMLINSERVYNGYGNTEGWVNFGPRYEDAKSQWKNFLGIGGNGLIDALEAYDA